jgi:hypothetical protein
MGRNIRDSSPSQKVEFHFRTWEKSSIGTKVYSDEAKIQTQDIFDDWPSSLINVFPLLVSFYSIWSAVVFWLSSHGFISCCLWFSHALKASNGGCFIIINRNERESRKKFYKVAANAIK